MEENKAEQGAKGCFTLKTLAKEDLTEKSDIWAKTWRRWGVKPCRWLGSDHPNREHSARAQGGTAQACVSDSKEASVAGAGRDIPGDVLREVRIFMNPGCLGPPNFIAGSNPSLCPFRLKDHSLPVHLGEIAFASSAFLTGYTAAYFSAFTWPTYSPPFTLFQVTLAVGISILYWFNAAASTLALQDDSSLLRVEKSPLPYSLAPMTQHMLCYSLF